MAAHNEASRFWSLLRLELNLPTDVPHNIVVSQYLGKKVEATLGDQFIKQIETHGHINRILVIGQTGVGKSSLINLLAGEVVTEVRDSAVGCTFDHVVIQIVHDGQIVELIDTVGLNENSQGTVTDEEAIEKLLQFIRSNQRGFNLLLFVMKKGRIHEMFENNFRLFSSIVSSGKVPAVLFVSQCEDDSPLNAWLQNEMNQRMLAPYSFSDIVCGTTKSGGRFGEKLQPLLEETESAVWNSILMNMSEEPIQIGDTRQLGEKIKAMWTSFWRGKQRSRVESDQATSTNVGLDENKNIFWLLILRIYKFLFPNQQQYEMYDDKGGVVRIENRKPDNNP